MSQIDGRVVCFVVYLYGRYINPVVPRLTLPGGTTIPSIAHKLRNPMEVLSVNQYLPASDVTGA
ncbi:MAG: hypothetical protein KAU31_07585 [Spirochaetaceae bacterium]|nr:hypothetical protein [Spirochaetaceae bacterium]